MGGNFTEFGVGPVIFFPITAIFSVAMLTLALTLSIRGMMIAPEKRDTFLAIFISAASFAIIFFYAVMSYQWLSGDTAYDGLYHSIGYLGSLVIGIVAMSVAGANKTGSVLVTLLSIGIPYTFLIFNAVLTTFFITLAGRDAIDTGALTLVIGFLYASIQIVVPLGYFLYIQHPANKERAIQKRRARIPAPAVSEPQIASVPHSEVPQHTINGQ